MTETSKATMTRRSLLAATAAGAMIPAVPAHAKPGRGKGRGPSRTIRVATYNASLNRETQGQLVRDLSTPANAQAAAVAEAIQRVRPDVLLVNEFDHDDAHAGVDLFRENYLQVSQRGQEPITYPYAFTAPVNTGVPSGVDLNNDGDPNGPDDAFGFGLFPGQYGMVVYSRFPIRTEQVRTFQHLLWKDMPDNLIPTDYYSPEAVDVLRLSSKSHWDVPIEVDGRVLHALVAHPTPPSFDGPEDRNGRRNNDEIRFWADYLSPRKKDNAYIVDDAGVRGGLAPRERFVILGDYNSDPADGDSWPGAIDQLLTHPRVRDPKPTSEGAVEAAALQGGANTAHRTPAKYDTADFSDEPSPGNLRVDYALPSRSLKVTGSGVFWPKKGQPGSDLTGEYPFPTSDHRPVWVDLRVR